MFAVRTFLLFIFVTLWYNYANAEPRDLQACEAHLNVYRKFLLQAILNFEDVCDAYSTRATQMADSNMQPQISFFGHYQPPEQKAEIWTFIKLIMGQFDDVDFANVMRDAIVERCRNKMQQQLQRQQRDEKRNTVVLGKKQRFHSWGGKRSAGGADATNGLDQEHNDDMTLTY